MPNAGETHWLGLCSDPWAPFYDCPLKGCRPSAAFRKCRARKPVTAKSSKTTYCHCALAWVCKHGRATGPLLAQIRSAPSPCPSPSLRETRAFGASAQITCSVPPVTRDLTSLFWCLQNNKKARLACRRAWPALPHPLGGGVRVLRGGANCPSPPSIGRA